MENSILREALRWHRAGWSIIPIRQGEKKSAVPWTNYKTQSASEQSIRRWFRDTGCGLAVIFGPVSGNLASMDFDELKAFEQWERDHPELAQTLPLVETSRGRHVYFEADPDDLRRTREALGKNPNGTGAIHLPAGELRAGVGCYSVLPPSIHPSGFQYRWIREPELPLPVVSLSEFIPAACYREDRENGGLQRELRTLAREGKVADNDSRNIPEILREAIQRTLPTTSGQRHAKIFNFARELKALPTLADASFSDLKPIVRHWHKQALPKIRTKPFEETWYDFCEGWQKIRFPAGEEPIQMIVQKALSSDLPEIARQCESPKVQALIAICRELQRAAGAGPFFLSARTAGRLVDVTPTQANRYLRGLCRDEVLREIQKGSQASKKASRYRYLHEL